MKRNTEQNTSETVLTQDQSTAKTLSSSIVEPIKTLGAEDRLELERSEAYVEPKTRDVLRKLLQVGDKEEIIPTYTPGLGFEYQISNSILKENDTCKLSKEFLENLTRLDILQKKFYDSVSACPNCKSTTITLHNRCPKCKSHNVNKASLTEHIPCGYIDQRDKYIENRCPRCNEALVEGQYRNMGRWYMCKECGERFEDPDFDLVCRNCNRNFTIKEGQVLDVPKFSLNLSRKKEIRQNVASLEDIRMLLTELGFNINMPGLIIGQKSGMQHHFSLIAKKEVSGQAIAIALDHAVSDAEVQASPLILYIYKTSEVKVDIPIFVAMPKLSETGRKIAEGHNILLIEASTDEQEIILQIKKQVEERIKQIEDAINQKTLLSEPETQKEKSSFLNRFRMRKS